MDTGVVKWWLPLPSFRGVGAVSPRSLWWCCCHPPPTGGAVILLHRVVLRSSIFRWAVLLWVAPRPSPSLVWWCSSSSVVLVSRPYFLVLLAPHPFGVVLLSSLGAAWPPLSVVLCCLPRPPWGGVAFSLSRVGGAAFSCPFFCVVLRSSAPTCKVKQLLHTCCAMRSVLI